MCILIYLHRSQLHFVRLDIYAYMAAKIYIIYLGYSELYYIPLYLWLLRIKCYLLERVLLSIYMAMPAIAM